MSEATPETVRHETVYDGWDGHWFEWHCEECDWHALISSEEIVKLERGDLHALHSGSSECGLQVEARVE